MIQNQVGFEAALDFVRGIVGKALGARHSLADKSSSAQAVDDHGGCQEGQMESQARLRRVLDLLLEVDLERMGALFKQVAWQEKSDNGA